jgi:hypothetical protein
MRTDGDLQAGDLALAFRLGPERRLAFTLAFLHGRLRLAETVVVRDGRWKMCRMRMLL